MFLNRQSLHIFSSLSVRFSKGTQYSVEIILFSFKIYIVIGTISLYLYSNIDIKYTGLNCSIRQHQFSGHVTGLQ